MKSLYVAALACAISLPVFGAAPKLPDVLAKLDQSSASFRAMTAEMHRITHTAVLNESTEEKGKISILRVKPGDLRVLVDIATPDPRLASFEQRKAYILYPKINELHIYDLGKHSRLVDQLLLLGFGTSGRELAKAYDVKVLGEESLGGKNLTKLELVPKSAEAREQVRKVELWLDETGDYPVQQKFYQPSGDYILITYSSVRINPSITPDAVKMQVPKNVKKVTPQK